MNFNLNINSEIKWIKSGVGDPFPPTLKSPDRRQAKLIYLKEKRVVIISN